MDNEEEVSELLRTSSGFRRMTFRHRIVWPLASAFLGVYIWLRFYDFGIAMGLVGLSIAWSIFAPLLIRRRLYKSMNKMMYREDETTEKSSPLGVYPDKDKT